MKVNIEDFKVHRTNEVLGTALNQNNPVQMRTSLRTKEAKPEETKLSPFEHNIITQFRCGKSVREIAKSTFNPAIRIEADDQQWERWVQRIYRIIESNVE